MSHPKHSCCSSVYVNCGFDVEPKVPGIQLNDKMKKAMNCATFVQPDPNAFEKMLESFTVDELTILQSYLEEVKMDIAESKKQFPDIPFTILKHTSQSAVDSFGVDELTNIQKDIERVKIVKINPQAHFERKKASRCPFCPIKDVDT